MRNIKRNIFRFGTVLLVVGAFSVTLAVKLFDNPQQAHAAATITVDSEADNSTAGDGFCTLREALANADADSDTTSGDCTAGSGTDTIEFAIPGSGVHTISATDSFSINEPVIIDGFSQNQTGSVAVPNNAVAPNPLNAQLKIEIDGSGAGSSKDGFRFLGDASGSSGSTIKGLVINGFDGSGIVIQAQNITVSGNYIGTDSTGMTAVANSWAGVTNNPGHVTSDAHIGSTSAADRNLISGNGSAGMFPYDGWIIQGNYVGVKANGTQALPNATLNTSGGMSIDNCTGVQVGGTTASASNVVSGNASHGIAPSNATDMHIEGNYIGTDYTGTSAIPNNDGMVIDGDLTGSVIGGTIAGARNIISGNTLWGIASSASGGLKIQGNYIGLNATGDAPISNGGYGVGLAGSNASNGTIIGGSVAGRNVISGNTNSNVSLVGFSGEQGGATISSNFIGTNASGDIDSTITSAQGMGIDIRDSAGSGYGTNVLSHGNLIGGTTSNQANRIAGNRGMGIGVMELDVPWYLGGVSLIPKGNAILGNQIYGNVTGGSITGNEGIGIDNFVGGDNTGSDFVEDTFSQVGVTANDPGDTDAGPNSYMNFPVVNSTTQNGTAVSVNFSIGANNSDTSSNTYRVEFFSNDANSREGQTYLGAATNVSNGDNQTANITIPSGIDLTGKYITATTTAINTTTASGYGSSSEFSAPSSNVTVTASSIFTYTDPEKSTTVTLVLPSGASSGTVSGVNYNSLPKDGSNNYPVGLTTFQFNVTQGATKTMTLYYDLPGNPSDYVARKYDDRNTHAYSDIAGATITREDYNGKSLLKLTYDITDGGVLDLDGSANGTIVDPVGLATASSALANTGQNIMVIVSIAGALIITSGVIVKRYARK